MTTTDHVHALAEEDGDECACGQLLCPDTKKPVGYDDTPRTARPDGSPSYWHLDGSTCFIHQTVHPTIEARWHMLIAEALDRLDPDTLNDDLEARGEPRGEPLTSGAELDAVAALFRSPA